MALFGPPNVAKLDAQGKIDGLVKAAKYKKDPEVAAAARGALAGYLDKIIERLQTKNLVQLDTTRDALVIIGQPARDRLDLHPQGGPPAPAPGRGLRARPDGRPGRRQAALSSRCTTPTRCCA